MDNKRVRTWPKGEQDRFVQMVDAHIQAVGDPDEQGFVTVRGEAAVYGNWFTVAEGDSYIVQRRNNQGMFGRSLGQNPDIALRVNHETALARTQAGTLKVWETDKALMFEGRVNTNTTAGNDIVQNMKDGLVTQGSVMYWPTTMETWEEISEDKGKTTMYQDIKEGKIDKGDVSLVVWGANPQCQTTLAQMVQMAQTQPAPVVEPEPEPEPVEQSEPEPAPAAVGELAVEAVAGGGDDDSGDDGDDDDGGGGGVATATEPEPEPEPGDGDDLLLQKERAKVLFQFSLSADPVKRYGV